jgi:hypothetical protein
MGTNQTLEGGLKAGRIIACDGACHNPKPEEATG